MSPICCIWLNFADDSDVLRVFAWLRKVDGFLDVIYILLLIIRVLLLLVGCVSFHVGKNIYMQHRAVYFNGIDVTLLLVSYMMNLHLVNNLVSFYCCAPV